MVVLYALIELSEAQLAGNGCRVFGIGYRAEKFQLATTECEENK